MRAEYSIRKTSIGAPFGKENVCVPEELTSAEAEEQAEKAIKQRQVSTSCDFFIKKSSIQSERPLINEERLMHKISSPKERQSPRTN